MAGPVYYTDMFPKETRLPDYYNGKLFIYDWIRGWIKVVTLQQDGDFDKMEPFIQGTKLNNVIDMEVGPDGKLYLLEYGSGWFSKNPDASLARIDYNGGNRAPLVAGVTVDKTSGALPFKVVATVDAKDLERDELTYEWTLGDGTKKETKEPRLEHTFTKAGDYAVSVVVKDDEGATTKSGAVSVYAGNEAPAVAITVEGNKTFYFPNQPVSYAVTVTDRDDASIANDVANAFVSADYVEGLDKAGASMGHQIMSEAMMGRNLVQSSDCKSCHKETETSIGPAYTAVAQRYQKKPEAVSHLINKIIKGGGGVWGETVMPAHPGLTESDARQMVSWVLSLAGGAQQQKSLPAKGTVKPTLDKKPTDNGVLVLSASYTDKGGAGIKPQIGTASVALRNPNVSMAAARNLAGYTTMTYGGRVLMMVPKDKASFSLDSIDLTGIGALELTVAGDKPPQYGYAFELYLDGPGGKKVGEGTLPAGAKFIKGPGGFGGTMITVNMEPVADGRMHNLYVVSRALNASEAGTLVITSVQFKAGKAPADVVRR